MSPRKYVQLPLTSEEEATREIKQYLKGGDGVLDMEKVIIKKIEQETNPHSWKPDLVLHSEIYHQVCWNLVSRAILYPIPLKMDPTKVNLGQYDFKYTNTSSSGAVAPNLYLGLRFKLTPYGKQWLEEEDGIFDCLPTEYGRFGQFLQSYTEKFGDGYKARSREAVGCYQHRLYLSCLLYTSPSPRDKRQSRMPSSA